MDKRQLFGIDKKGKQKEGQPFCIKDSGFLPSSVSAARYAINASKIKHRIVALPRMSMRNFYEWQRHFKELMNSEYDIGNELLLNIALPDLCVLGFVRLGTLDRRKRSFNWRWQLLWQT
jgi:hypothetical protein